MEEEIYKLKVLLAIKSAISNTYSDVNDTSKYHECMELVNEVEIDIVDHMEELLEKEWFENYKKIWKET